LEITDEGTTNLSFAGNYTKTKVDAGPNLIGDKAKCYEECLPTFRGNMTFTHQQEKWRALARVHYHSGYYEPHLDDPTLPIFPSAEVMLDIEFAYNVMEEVELTIGATNLFNNYPDLNPYGKTVVGAKYPTTAPLGFNGGFWYAKVKYNF
jgi:iron complex outermembrane receptor protein